MMRARAMVHYAPTPQQAVAQFKALVERTDGADWAYYGLVVALSRAGDHDDALDTAKPLFAKHPDSLLYMATEAELLIARGTLRRRDRSCSPRNSSVNPENKPLSILYADALNGAKRYREAEAVLLRQSVRNAGRHRRLVRTRRNRGARRRHRAGAPGARRVFRARRQSAEEHSASRVRARTGEQRQLPPHRDARSAHSRSQRGTRRKSEAQLDAQAGFGKSSIRCSGIIARRPISRIDVNLVVAAR